jgi:alpha-L-rhamnosidase
MAINIFQAVQGMGLSMKNLTCPSFKVATFFLCTYSLLCPTEIHAQPPHLSELKQRGAESPLSTFIVPPKRIVWVSDQSVKHAENLLLPRSGQATLSESIQPVVLPPGTGLVLDFGVELQGNIEIITPMVDDQRPPTIRVRLGESVSECMAELGEKGAQNDHALRDQAVQIPWLGKTVVGPSGFRFLRIDNVQADRSVKLAQVAAQFILRDLPYVGSFECSDQRLNDIWQTGAYTVQLNMQEYLWDGIKRDRLVWLGDMHPEVSVINTVFGKNAVVPDSLDLIRDMTPVEAWMNGISSYSMWWVIIHEQWYLHHGDIEYLRQQHPYLTALITRLATYVDSSGREKLDGMRFLDWPTFEDKAAVHEGLQALMSWCMQSGARIAQFLNDEPLAELCAQTAAALSQHQPPVSGRKSPAALLALTGLRDLEETADALLAGGPKDLSTFYGFYVINALGEAKRIEEALDMIRQYWGGMLDFGATTFWEDFDLEWTKNAARIDELVPEGKDDLHGDFGAHCYIGFRHSLCHGWAGGPTHWLSRYVLGIQPISPGCRQMRIAPQLGDLQWARGTYPTPYGPVSVALSRDSSGRVTAEVQSPPEVECIVDLHSRSIADEQP